MVQKRSLGLLFLWLCYLIGIPLFIAFILILHQFNSVLSPILGYGMLLLILIFGGMDLFKNKKMFQNYFIKKPRLIFVSTIFCIIWPICFIVIDVPTLNNNSNQNSNGQAYPYILVEDGVGIYNIPNYAIIYRTAIESIQNLHYGINPTNMSNEKDLQPSYIHVYNLKNLLSNTSYYFQLDQGNLYKFHTPSNQFTVALSSDPHFGIGNTIATQMILNAIQNPSKHIDLFFLLGDIVDDGGSISQWDEAINFLDARSNLTNVVPDRPLIGNHDTLLNGIDNYLTNFYPSSMDTQYSSSRQYYRIDIFNVHFLLLDLEWGNSSNTPAQQTWLQAQLTSIPPNDTIVVLDHCFFYSSGTYIDGTLWANEPTMIQQFTPLFQQYHVDFVFSGHNHQLEVLQDNGTIYSIVGGMGGPLEEDRTVNGTGSLWYTNKQYGYMTLTFDSNSTLLSVFNTKNNLLYSLIKFPKNIKD